MLGLSARHDKSIYGGFEKMYISKETSKEKGEEKRLNIEKAKKEICYIFTPLASNKSGKKGEIPSATTTDYVKESSQKWGRQE